MGGDGSHGSIPGEITWKLRPGEEATFLSRKAAYVFDYHGSGAGGGVLWNGGEDCPKACNWPVEEVVVELELQKLQALLNVSDMNY